LRPVLIVGEAAGGAMDLIPPLGVYAAVLREEGRALDYPGGAARVSQAVDVDLLARAIGWAGEAEAARNEAFNVTNGDVFRWERMWADVATHLGLAVAAPVPLTLARHMADKGPLWRELAARHGLVESELDQLVGWGFGDGLPPEKWSSPEVWL
jgi:nucleoside-diphosphate-sugar epimerase